MPFTGSYTIQKSVQIIDEYYEKLRLVKNYMIITINTNCVK